MIFTFITIKLIRPIFTIRISIALCGCQNHNTITAGKHWFRNYVNSLNTINFIRKITTMEYTVTPIIGILSAKCNYNIFGSNFSFTQSKFITIKINLNAVTYIFWVYKKFHQNTERRPLQLVLHILYKHGQDLLSLWKAFLLFDRPISVLKKWCDTIKSMFNQFFIN